MHRFEPISAGSLPCENKSLSGPREPGHASFATAFFLLRFTDTLPDRRVYQPENPQLYAFGLVDALGAKKSDNHLVYFLFRSLHNAGLRYLWEKLCPTARAHDVLDWACSFFFVGHYRHDAAMLSVLWQEGTGRALWLVMRHRRQLSSEYFQRGRCGKLGAGEAHP